MSWDGVEWGVCEMGQSGPSQLPASDTTACTSHLANLAPAQKVHAEGSGNVVFFISRIPTGSLDRVFRKHRPGLHRGVDLVSSAVQEAGVDEKETGGGVEWCVVGWKGFG